MKSNSAVVWKYISNVSQCWSKSRLGRQRGCGSPSSTERFSWDKLVWATQTNLKPTFFRFDRFETAIFLYFDRMILLFSLDIWQTWNQHLSFILWDAKRVVSLTHDIWRSDLDIYCYKTCWRFVKQARCSTAVHNVYFVQYIFPRNPTSSDLS